MADQGRWFKLWTSVMSDPSLGNLGLDDFARWCLFGVFLKEHGTSGELTVQSAGLALMRLFQLDAFEDAIKVLQKFPNCTVTPVTNAIVTYNVRWDNWQKYQGDNSSERTRLWRKRQRESVTVKKRREQKRIRREETLANANVTALSGTPDEALELLAFLNHKAGRNFQPGINADFIRARLKAGATVGQCRAVIGLKAGAWKGTEMEKYLRPATLFNATKFAQYLGELPATAFSSQREEQPHA